MLKHIKRGLIVCMLTLVFLVLAYLLGVKTYDAPKKEKTQGYETDSTLLRTTKAQRLSYFQSTLEKAQQSGGGEVIFEGGKGFVLFRVRNDGTLVAMVPVFASVLHISSRTLFRLILLSKRYYTIRLTSWDKEQLDQIAPFHNVSEREVPYPKTDPHIFREAELGSDISTAAELAETVLTKVFHVKKSRRTIYAGDYREFRSSAPLGG